MRDELTCLASGKRLAAFASVKQSTATGSRRRRHLVHEESRPSVWSHHPSCIPTSGSFHHCTISHPSVTALSELSLDPFSSSSPTITWLADAVPTKEFEPVTDWAALGTFLSIMFVAILLVRRTRSVERAVMEREESLQLVRELKSKELAGSGVSSNNREEMTAEMSESATTYGPLEKALKRYESAVEQEERLRNIVPGVVRIVPPSAGNKVEENAALAAKQFLGKDYDIGVPKREDNPSGKLPMVALGILALLGVSLTALLFLLSMDPKTASSFLKDL